MPIARIGDELQRVGLALSRAVGLLHQRFTVALVIVDQGAQQALAQGDFIVVIVLPLLILRFQIGDGCLKLLRGVSVWVMSRVSLSIGDKGHYHI